MALAIACALTAAACTANIDEPGAGSGGGSSNGGTPGTGTTGGRSAGGAAAAGAGATTPGSGGSAVGNGGAGVGTGATSSSGGAGVGGSPVGSGGAAAGSSGSGQVFPNPPPFQPAPGTLRRLTRTQFRNALFDVFGVEVDLDHVDADSWTGNFAVIGATSVVTSDVATEQYQTAVENVVKTAFADTNKRNTLIGCTPAAGAQNTCIRGFVERMGRRAWRRPLEAAEIDRLATLASNAATELADPYQGVQWATVALFTSPHFLYRPELGATANGATGLKLTAYELASRLSFLLTNSAPDAALLDQAGTATLTTPAGLRDAATRLLGTAAGRAAVGAFADEFMRLDRLATQAKDLALYPEYTEALQTAMARDMRGTWETLAFDDQASALDLLTTPKVVVNKELAQVYGLSTTGLDSGTFKVMTLPAGSPRVGILGKSGFLSQHANQKEGSPTLRGKYIRELLMCATVPPPPDDVSTMLEDPPAGVTLTKREKLEKHRTEQACAGCHSLMDPMGLPFETFDSIGRYRTMDSGKPIDTSGNYMAKPVANAAELATAINQDIATAQCLVRKYHAYAMGHAERAEDGSVINTLAASFQSSGYKLRDLVLAVVTHDAFSSVAPQP